MFVPARNGQALPRASVPLLDADAFGEELTLRAKAGGRVVAMFGVPQEAFEVFAVVADPSTANLWLGRTRGDRFASLTPTLPQVHLYERELAEQHGVVIEGRGWLKPVRFAPPLRSGPGNAAPSPVGVMEFFRVESDEIHEVAVGPVHAGVIEPGHFRFQCHGEQVLHLEISLGYQHRGVERALQGGPNKRSLHLIETLAGDSTVAHATAYCTILEGLANAAAPPRALALRGVALELERLANHTGDLGALAGDVGFLPTASFCGRLRGDWLNLTAQLCGSRFGRGLIVPGGVGFCVDEDRADAMVGRLHAAMADLRPSMQLLWDTPSVMSRFEETGVVTPQTAESIGLVGPAARASKLPRDARVEFPAGIFLYEQLPISTWSSGDVFARAWVRALEIDRSALFTRQRLENLPAGGGLAPVGPPRADSVCVAMVEGWRGEVVHAALTDDRGQFAVYKIVDPSFHNWMGLAMAMRKQQISDFPLCNKSFNLSYCGFDL